MTVSINRLKEQINNVTELSGICRGEWCRSLESKVDELNDQLDLVETSCKAGNRTVAEMKNKISKAYRNFAPEICF